MKKQLMLLLTLSALLAYRPGHAQAHAGRTGDSPTLVASARTKSAAMHAAPEVTTAKTAKKETTTAKKPQNAIGRAWSRIMGICTEVHQASKAKS